MFLPNDILILQCSVPYLAMYNGNLEKVFNVAHNRKKHYKKGFEELAVLSVS